MNGDASTKNEAGTALNGPGILPTSDLRLVYSGKRNFWTLASTLSSAPLLTT